MSGEKQREHIYEILIGVFANYEANCSGNCVNCEYSDRGRCGMLVDAMAKAIYDAGYHPTEKGGAEE